MSARKNRITNDYTPDGRKLSSQHVTSIAKGGGSYIRRVTNDLYIDGLILRGGKPLMWLFDGGYVALNDNGTPTSWNYYVADHLGSTRMVVGSDNSIKETISYYPFGSEMRMLPPTQATGDLQHPFRFTGKELDRLNGMNWYDFGARWYDVAGVPMWTSVDPLAEGHPEVTPYMYCAGAPVDNLDPDGEDYWSTDNKEEIISFFNALGSGQTQFDFSKWQHATDAEITGNLAYNDETHKYYTSYSRIIDGELHVIGKSFDANLTPVSFSGAGYSGAFVYQPTCSSWKQFLLSLDGGLKYNDGHFNWKVDLTGRITGFAPLIGMPPVISLKGGKQVEKMGRAIKNMSGNRNVQQKQFDQLKRKYRLSEDQSEELHRIIHGEGYEYKEIEEIIKDLFAK